MARKELLECEAHPDGCPGKGGVLPLPWYDPDSGDPLVTELCEPEWARYAAVFMALREVSRLDPEPRRRAAVMRRTPTKVKDDTELGWGPLFEAAKDQIREINRIQGGGPMPKGKASRNSLWVRKFLATPAGKAWQGWTPEKPLPSEVPSAQERRLHIA